MNCSTPLSGSSGPATRMPGVRPGVENAAVCRPRCTPSPAGTIFARCDSSTRRARASASGSLPANAADHRPAVRAAPAISSSPITSVASGTPSSSASHAPYRASPPPADSTSRTGSPLSCSTSSREPQWANTAHRDHGNANRATARSGIVSASGNSSGPTSIGLRPSSTSPTSSDSAHCP
jgi:hypothetical protein